MNSDILDILKYTIPSIVALTGMYFMLAAFFDRDEKERNYELRKLIHEKNTGIVLPLRLQAYERTILFLERIHPNSILHRVRQPGMSAQDLHLALTRTIREEYEYNLSQQIYLSKEAWAMVTTVKEELVKLINLLSANMPAEASSMDLSRAILDYFIQSEKEVPTQLAINYIKEDVKQFF